MYALLAYQLSYLEVRMDLHNDSCISFDFQFGDPCRLNLFMRSGTRRAASSRNFRVCPAGHCDLQGQHVHDHWSLIR